MYIGEPFPKDKQRTAYGSPRLTTAADRRASKPDLGSYERRPGDTGLEWVDGKPVNYAIPFPPKDAG